MARSEQGYRAAPWRAVVLLSVRGIRPRTPDPDGRGGPHPRTGGVYGKAVGRGELREPDIRTVQGRRGDAPQDIAEAETARLMRQAGARDFVRFCETRLEHHGRVTQFIS